MEGDFQVGQWLVQPKLNSLTRNGKTARVEPKVMQVLVCLAGHAGDVVEKERLIRAVWADTFVTDDVLTRAISELRKALDDDAQEPQFIETIPKVGYRLIAPAGKVGAPVGTVHGLHRSRKILAVMALPVIALLAIVAYFATQQFWPKSPPPASKIRLVVLPFDNLSGDPEQEFFSDGMTEELTAQLARLQPERLLVIGRTSAMTYKGHKKTIDEIGKELDVQYMLEGSVRRDGNRVRVTAQLIEVGDQTHVWAEEYDRDLGGILAMQEEVALGVAREIRLTLTPKEMTRAGGGRPVNPGAHEDYLQGRYFWNRRTPAFIMTSIDYYQGAIQKDPGYALAYAGLADSLLFFDSERAKAAAIKAIELDGSLAEPHATLAFLRLREWDWAGAQREFQQAILLNPNYPTAHHWYAGYFEAVGLREEAIAELRRALELDPMSLIIRSALAQSLADAGQTDEAIAQIGKVLKMDPGFARGHWALSRIHARAGRLRQAVAEIRKAKELGCPLDEVLETLGYAYAVAGKKEDAKKMIAEIQELLRQENRSDPGMIAGVYAALGDKERALALLEKAVDQRKEIAFDLKLDPILSSLRSDPRFQDLLRRMNFPP